MPQVNTLAIEIAPSNNFSPVQSGATSSSKNSNKDFSQVIEQHYKSQQTQQSGKKQEASGNKVKLDTDVKPEKENNGLQLLTLLIFAYSQQLIDRVDIFEGFIFIFLVF